MSGCHYRVLIGENKMKKWSEKDELKLKELYCNKNISLEEISKIIGKTKRSVIYKANTLGLYRDKWNEKLEEKLKELFKNPSIKPEEIEKTINKKWGAIRQKAYRMGLTRPLYKPYIPVEDYFETIDSIEKSYWLGFFAADGGICTNNVIRINLSVKDIKQLENFRDAIAPGQEIKVDPIYEKMRYLSISCKKIVNDLKALGMGPGKGETLHYPIIDSIYDIPFIMGLFDGDGSIGIDQRDSSWWFEICGAYNVLELSREKLNKILNIELLEIKKHTQSNFLYRLRTQGTKAEIILNEFEKYDIGLKRKRISGYFSYQDK